MPSDWSIDLDSHFKPKAPLGFGPFGERAPLPANDQGSTLSRTVSDDLDAIFADSPPPQPTRRPARVHSVGAQPRDTAGRASRITAWGGVIAAAVAGVVVGTIIVKQPPKAPPPPAAAAVAQAPSARELAPSLPAPAATPPPAAQVAAAPAVQADAPRAVAQAKVAPPRSRPAVRRAAPTRSAVLAADRELRQAYAAATRAGVPRGKLVSVRNRWAALRDDPPARLISGYASLTRELRQQAARSPHRKRGLFG